LRPEIIDGADILSSVNFSAAFTSASRASGIADRRAWNTMRYTRDEVVA